MKPFLLDVNVLIALAWRAHVHHAQAQEWFARNRASGFCTCPLTQAGFVRISSNPRFSVAAVSPSAALDMLDQFTSMPAHQFWADDLPLRAAIPATQSLVGHQQITDAYLIALAESKGGVLATLDRGVLSVSSDPDLVELIC